MAHEVVGSARALGPFVFGCMIDISPHLHTALLGVLFWNDGGSGR